MVLAQTADSHRELSRQFHDRETTKAYIALLYGVLPTRSGSVTLPLMTDWPNRPRQMVSEEGKHAHTDYEVLEVRDGITRVLLTPITGRSHQLRVHMLELGYPIIGDNLYAEGEALVASDRLALHAWRLGFKHPTNSELMSFEVEPDF